MPLADGETDTASRFEASGEHSSPLPIGFELKGVEPGRPGAVMTRILITGSTTGVGRATAAALLEDGQDVVHARSQDRLAAVEDLDLAHVTQA